MASEQPQNPILIPTMIKHATMAILKDKNIKGSPKDRFVSAFNIAKSRFAEYGFMRQTPIGVIPTGRGLLREVRHRLDGKFLVSRKFDELYKKFIMPPPQKTQEKRG